MIYFKINQELTCDKICKQIQNYLSKTKVDDNSLLIIEIKNISQDDNNLIPKLPHYDISDNK